MIRNDYITSNKALGCVIQESSLCIVDLISHTVRTLDQNKPVNYNRLKYHFVQSSIHGWIEFIFRCYW